MNDPSLQKIYYQCNNNLLELNGINNLSISKSTSFADQFILGGDSSLMQVNAPEQIEVSFDRSFIEIDDLFRLTGSFPVEKMYVYDSKKFYLIKSLYLNSYSAGFSVGELPKINTKFTSYGTSITQNSNPLLPIINSTNQYDIPKLGSISITGTSSSEINNIYNIFSFEYSIDINRQPLYTIGSLEPTEVCPILPLKINFSINSKMKDEESLIKISSRQQDNLDFYISVSGDTSTMSFPIRKAQLVSSDIVLSSANTLEVKHQFIGHYGLY
jgi:hypothetical protein